MKKNKSKRKDKVLDTKAMSFSPLIPLRDKVVLEEMEERSGITTAYGIIIPESANSERDTKKGRVVAVGEGKIVDGKREPVSVKIGKVVLYSWGDTVKVSGKKYIVVSEENIAAIIK